MSKKLKAISLFSGAGGDTLGMKQSGIDVLGYVEYNKSAIETHNHNFKECKLIGEDITKIKNADFSEYVGKVDLLFGGFPCQSFSHGGNKKANDSRGFLYREFVRIAKYVKPRVIIGENVKGLLTRKTEDDILFLDMIIDDFLKIGYKLQYTLFNMKDYGLPQDRQRILIYGFRQDLNFSMDLRNINNDMPKKYNKDILQYSLKNALQIDNESIIKMIPEGKYIEDKDDVSIAGGNPPTNLIKCCKNEHLSFKKRSKSIFSCIIDKDDISRTILSTYSRMPRLFVPIKNATGVYLRPYTILELQLIQGFPKDFVFKGSEIEQIIQIGNAIPPVFICNVMDYITGILNENLVEI
jgi:DNA (cytosine-5)-methyltransferase 1